MRFTSESQHHSQANQNDGSILIQALELSALPALASSPEGRAEGGVSRLVLVLKLTVLFPTLGNTPVAKAEVVVTTTRLVCDAAPLVAVAETPPSAMVLDDAVFVLATTLEDSVAVAPVLCEEVEVADAVWTVVEAPL